MCFRLSGDDGGTVGRRFPSSSPHAPMLGPSEASLSTPLSVAADTVLSSSDSLGGGWKLHCGFHLSGAIDLDAGFPSWGLPSILVGVHMTDLVFPVDS